MNYVHSILEKCVYVMLLYEAWKHVSAWQYLGICSVFSGQRLAPGNLGFSVMVWLEALSAGVAGQCQ